LAFFQFRAKLDDEIVRHSWVNPFRWVAGLLAEALKGEAMTGTEFFELSDLHALGTSLIVLGLAFVFSGLVFMLPSQRKRSVPKEDE
jgi:hypothetical protein